MEVALFVTLDSLKSQSRVGVGQTAGEESMSPKWKDLRLARCILILPDNLLISRTIEDHEVKLSSRHSEGKL